MWKFDLKRILIKKKGLIIIAAALILEFLSLRQSYSYRVDSEVEENKNLYMMYMEKYGGMADEGRYKELNEEIEMLEENIKNANNAWEKYHSGEITRAQVSEIQKKGLPYYDNLEVLKSIRVQYNYALENERAGIIMYETGWLLLLGREYSDIILPVAIVLIIISMFTEDYTYEMYRITDCCKNGKNKLFFNRIIASAVTAFILCVAIMAVDYLYFYFKYGLENPLENILNIKGLKDAPIRLSLIANYLLTGVQMMLGSIVIIFITAFFGQLMKNRFYGVIAVLILYIFPYIFFEKEQWIKYMLPISFFTDGGYINGFEVLQDTRLAVNGEEALGKMLFGILIISLILIIALHNNRKRKNTFFLIVMFFFITLTGCVSGKPSEKLVLYNSEAASGMYESGDMLILQDNDGVYWIYIGDKKLPLYDNPFSLDVENRVSYMTTNGDKVYYQVDENANGNKCVKFYELDTKSMERKIILEKNVFMYESNSYLDINRRISTVDTENFFNCMLEFAADDFIIYRNGYDIIFYDRTMGKEKKILERADNLCIYKGKLYYTNQQGYIMVYDFETDTTHTILDEFVIKYQICDSKIVYIDGISLNIKLYNLKNKTSDTIIECEAEKLIVNEGKIYYYYDNGKLSVYDMETEKTVEIAENVNIYSVLRNRKQVLYVDYYDNYYEYNFK